MIAMCEQVRLADRLAMKKYGIPSLELMKNAAAAVFRVLQRENIKNKRVCILSGKGNNAGDGFALAVMLRALAQNVQIVLLCGDDFTGDAAYYYRQCRQLKIAISDDLPTDYDIYVDAVFGTGFRGALPDHVRAAFERVNALPAMRVAIDLPSGIEGDSGIVHTGAFRAQETVTFQVMKLCHLLPQSAAFCGAIRVENIGLPEAALSECGIVCERLEHFDLPPKDPAAHKGMSGTLFGVVGSRCYQGAAALSLNAALRCGCGIVAGVIPNGIYLPVACKTSSAVLYAYPENQDGMLSFSSFDDFVELIRLRRPAAILAGSGMGVSDDTERWIAGIMDLDIPAVIDGDGLRYFTKRAAPTVLTPHIGEFSRMTGLPPTHITANRLAISRQFAAERGCVLVLKDYITVICAPDGGQWLFSAPNAGLAKGGSGDVLAGMIVSFLAQGFPAADAAKAGVLYHAGAAKLACADKGTYGMLPEDVIAHIPEALPQNIPNRLNTIGL